jgi:signal recognition particle GTPase
MSTQLKLPTDVVRNATFSRVHRIGKASGNRPRDIIACFDQLKQKEMMKNMGKELRNTDFGMNDHFPTEINDIRKTRYPS